MGYLYCIGNPRPDWGYKTAPDSGLGGRILGGCSSINGMIYMRGQAREYDGWWQIGCTGWGWGDVLPLFKSQEDFVDGADIHHGAGGPLRVE